MVVATGRSVLGSIEYCKVLFGLPQAALWPIALATSKALELPRGSVLFS